MEEIWKDVVGYEEYLRVSNLGRIFSKRTNKILKLHIRKDRRVTFSTRLFGRNSKAICFKVHRLVAMAFIPNHEDKYDINHKDGNPSNNNVLNLEWVTRSENIIHAYENNLITAKKSFESKNCKLSPEDVKFIRDNYGYLTKRKIAEILNIGPTTVHAVANNLRH